MIIETFIIITLITLLYRKLFKKKTMKKAIQILNEEMYSLMRVRRVLKTLYMEKPSFELDHRIGELKMEIEEIQTAVNKIMNYENNEVLLEFMDKK